jgi:hypothetical protein
MLFGSVYTQPMYTPNYFASRLVIAVIYIFGYCKQPSLISFYNTKSQSACQFIFYDREEKHAVII